MFFCLRDIKPNNILIKIDQDDPHLDTISVCHMTVKLCDFGLARYYIADASSTVAMTTAGTKCYAAPEIRENLENHYMIGGMNGFTCGSGSVSKYTESCDIFSAAVVLCELVTGRLEPGKTN